MELKTKKTRNWPIAIAIIATLSFTSCQEDIYREDWDEMIWNTEAHTTQKDDAYIIDAVMLIIDQNRLDIRLGSDIYPFIRIKYDLSSDAIVEHAIRNAIKSAYSRRHKDEGASRMLNYNKKPTNKQFLLTVTHEVCRKMCSDLNIYPV